MTSVIKENEHKENEIGQALKEGAIVAFPTDTVYGLGAVYSDENAVKKIFEAKGRDEGKPLSILVGSIEQVEMLVEQVTPAARILMEKFWPGALTIILKKNQTVPDVVSAGGDTVGLRMPSNETAKRIILAAGSPLATPSANISGKRSAVRAQDVIEDLYGRIDIIVDGGECPIGVSSTVVDLSKDGLKILREGTVTREMLTDALNSAE